MSRKLSFNEQVLYFLGLTALFGPVLGYSSFYLFHAVLLLVLLSFCLKVYCVKKIKIDRLVCVFLVFYLYSVMTIVWVDGYSSYFRNLFYLTCALVIVLSVSALVKTDLALVKFSRLIVVVGFLQLIVGAAESFGLFRLPMSPYSNYYHYFGHTADVASEWSGALREYNLSKPTGFSGNPNTFGFVMLLVAPYLCLNSNKIVRFISLFLYAYVIYSIDSKSLFASFVLMFVFEVFFFRRSIYILFMSLCGVVLFVLISFSSIDLAGRMFNVFSEIQHGLHSIWVGDFSQDSTGFRAYLYSFGISKFISSYGLGIGLGGVEAALYNALGEHTAFHNFFLQILVDLGVIGLSVFLFYYFALLRYLYLGFVYFYNSDKFVSDIYKFTFLSLVLTLFSSLAPSGIFYNLSFWCVVGFSSGLVSYYKLKKNNSHKLPVSMCN